MASFDPYPKFTPVLRPLMPTPAMAQKDDIKRLAGNSLVAGLVGLIIFGIILGPYAILAGNRALKLIKSTGTGKQHSGTATGGIVAGSFAFLLHLAGLVLVALVFAGGGILAFAVWNSPTAKLIGTWEIDTASQMTPEQRSNPMAAMMSQMIEVNLEFRNNGAILANVSAFGQSKTSQGSWVFKRKLGPELVLEVDSPGEGTVEFYIKFNSDNEIELRGMTAPGEWDNKTLTLTRKKT